MQAAPPRPATQLLAFASLYVSLCINHEEAHGCCPAPCCIEGDGVQGVLTSTLRFCKDSM